MFEGGRKISHWNGRKREGEDEEEEGGVGEEEESLSKVGTLWVWQLLHYCPTMATIPTKVTRWFHLSYGTIMKHFEPPCMGTTWHHLVPPCTILNHCIWPFELHIEQLRSLILIPHSGLHTYSAQCAVWAVRCPSGPMHCSVQKLNPKTTFPCTFRMKTLKIVSLFIFRHWKHYFWNTQNQEK